MQTRTMSLAIEGLGFILYSPFATAHIVPGSDYLDEYYMDPSNVQREVAAGRLAGFATSSPGTYELRFHFRAPLDSEIEDAEFKIRLALEVRDGCFCIRDLYDLMKWDPSCPAGQTIAIDNGFYLITVCSSLPSTGIIGDEQQIDIFVVRSEVLPRVRHQGVPTLCE